MLVNIEQGTQEWHDLRKSKIGASDAPIIMGVSPWCTPKQLWEKKVYTKANEKESPFMKRGKDLEPYALERYNILTDNFSSPKVFISDNYSYLMASLDGLSVDGKTSVEIKCPGREDHEKAKNGIVPEKYYPQLQHQMLVVGCKVCHYFSYVHDDDYALIVVERDDEYIAELLEKLKQFWDCVQNFEEPQEIEKAVVRIDEQFLGLVPGWIEIDNKRKYHQDELKKLDAMEKPYRDQLIALCDGQTSKGGGLKIMKVTTKGSVDYSAIPELKDMDLEKYRKPSRESWRFKREE